MGAALITGASAGLGTEFARLFARDGHDTVLVARRRERLDALAGELHAAHGVRAHVLPADLGEPGAPARIHDEVGRLGIEVDYLVNNAGFGASGAFAEADLQRQMEMVRVNVAALVELTGLFVPEMIARKRGRILNIGSTAGFQPGPFMATYYATKAFVISFTDALAWELSGTGVTATVSCPGATATEFAGHAGNDTSILFRLGAADSATVAGEAYRAMMAGKRMVVHGAMNRVAAQSVRLSPRSMALALASWINRS